MSAPTDLDAIARELESFLNPESDEKQARKRELILHAAIELFIAYGYRKTTMDDVAGAAGVAKGTLYLYYRNKAELLLHAIALQKQQFLIEMAPLVDSALSPTDRLRALIELSITLSREMPLLAQFSGGDNRIEQALQDVDHETLLQIDESRVDFAASLIGAATNHALSREVVEYRAAVLVDLLVAVVSGGRLIREGAPLEEYSRVFADMIVGGIVQGGDIT